MPSEGQEGPPVTAPPPLSPPPVTAATPTGDLGLCLAEGHTQPSAFTGMGGSRARGFLRGVGPKQSRYLLSEFSVLLGCTFSSLLSGD